MTEPTRAQILAELLHKHGGSAAAFAKKLGIPRQWYQRYSKQAAIDDGETGIDRDLARQPSHVAIQCARYVLRVRELDAVVKRLEAALLRALGEGHATPEEAIRALLPADPNERVELLGKLTLESHEARRGKAA